MIRGVKKAQVASLDLVLSMVALLLFIGIIVAIMPLLMDKGEQRVVYGGQVFTNIEKLAISEPGIAFLSNHKIDEKLLLNFSNRSVKDIEKLVFANSDEFNSESNDICLFFLNYSQPFKVNGSNAIGHSGCDWSNPCPDYPLSFVFAKPVLRNATIMNMYLVICE